VREAVFSPAARFDLVDIWEYIYRNGSEFAADRFAGELIARCQRLALAPDIGRHRPEFGRDILGCTHKKYLCTDPCINTGRIMM